jgi:gas vesicle protein
MKKLMGYDVEDILELIGLQRHRSLLGMLIPAVGFVALGAVVGAGIGLAFAPSSGRRLRQDVSDRLDLILDRIKSEAQKTRVFNAPASASLGSETRG